MFLLAVFQIVFKLTTNYYKWFFCIDQMTYGDKFLLQILYNWYVVYIYFFYTEFLV